MSAALVEALTLGPVLPLHASDDGSCTCGNRRCRNVAKHPRTVRGLHDASADPQQVESWSQRWDVTNWGVRTLRAWVLWSAAVEQGKQLVARLDQCRFGLGDLALRLFPIDHARGQAKLSAVRKFAEEVGVTGGAMLDYRSIAHAFPPETRRANVTYSCYRQLMARHDRHDLVAELSESRDRVTLSALQSVNIPTGRTSAMSLELRVTRAIRNIDSVSAAILREHDWARALQLARRLSEVVEQLQDEAAQPVEVMSA